MQLIIDAISLHRSGSVGLLATLHAGQWRAAAQRRSAAERSPYKGGCMSRVIFARYRGVLGGTVIAACLLSGFILTKGSADRLWRSAVAQGSHVNSAAFPNLSPRASAPLPGANPESRVPNPVLAGPNPESRISSPGSAAAAQPRLV